MVSGGGERSQEAPARCSRPRRHAALHTLRIGQGGPCAICAAHGGRNNIAVEARRIVGLAGDGVGATPPCPL